ncbi:MAG: hypothetical protein KDB53_14880, partial [Planctomycetes bacterium]|nr:hypothetical protein [Planctomycetota bacterium]
VPPPSAWTVQADEPLPERNDQPRLPDIGYRESRESTDSGSTRRLLELLLGTAVVVAFLVYAFLRWQAQAGRRR